MFSTLPIELQKHILSHVYTHDAIYASMVCTSWRDMCEEIYKDYIPEDIITPNNTSIMSNNSHALKFYLGHNKNKLERNHIRIITNSNCLNILALIFLTYRKIPNIVEYSDACIILSQFIKTNNMSKPFIVKKLVYYVMGQTILDGTYYGRVCDAAMQECIINKSYDFGKYILCYYDSNNLDFALKCCENNIDNILKYFKFLIDNSAINFPYLYEKIHALRSYEHKATLLKFLEEYMDKDVMDMIEWDH
jgi:hypothetical protein